MGDIYAVANRVMSWLGAANIKEEDEKAALEVLRFLTWRFAALIAGNDSGVATSRRDVIKDDPMKTTPNELSQRMHERGFPNVWHSLNVMLSSYWFDRMWCVQEHLRAQEVIVLLRIVELPPMSLRLFSVWISLQRKRRTRD